MFDVHAHLTAPELLPHLETLLTEAHRYVNPAKSQHAIIIITIIAPLLLIPFLG
jgi:hypothetical protein